MMSNILIEISLASQYAQQSLDGSIVLRNLVSNIPQLKYIQPMNLNQIEGDKPFDELSFGGIIYTPEILRIASKLYPDVLLDLNPFQFKLFDEVYELDLKLARDSESGIPCLALIIPESIYDECISETIQIILEAAKTVENSGQVYLLCNKY